MLDRSRLELEALHPRWFRIKNDAYLLLKGVVSEQRPRVTFDTKCTSRQQSTCHGGLRHPEAETSVIWLPSQRHTARAVQVGAYLPFEVWYVLCQAHDKLSREQILLVTDMEYRNTALGRQSPPVYLPSDHRDRLSFKPQNSQREENHHTQKNETKDDQEFLALSIVTASITFATFLNGVREHIVGQLDAIDAVAILFLAKQMPLDKDVQIGFSDTPGGDRFVDRDHFPVARFSHQLIFYEPTKHRR